MPQFGEGDGNQHCFTCQEMEGNNCFVIKPLVVSKKAGEKGRNRDKKKEVVVRRGKGLHPWKNHPAHEKKDTAG